MGSFCSKPKTHSGGHTVLGGGAEPGSASASPRNETAEQRRERMLAAADKRQKEDKARLVNKNNPKAGQLASQANRPYKPTDQGRDEPPLRRRMLVLIGCVWCM
ncbi:hypothetical protein DFH11DRAFT_58625 [Phellopilus nigrolimitatus]|nr:hypothetical protein DFH11DRAFT_58625 [Phellopilus nigrolimitatus]